MSAKRESGHKQGPKTAPLVLTEYGDYQCPYCGEAYRVIKRVQQVLGEDLRLVFRHFPLSTEHPYAMQAARAAEAAGLQGKFWHMHDVLFENQMDLEPEKLIAYAEILGLDRESFTKDLKSQKVESRIDEDLQSAVNQGVDETPCFFINGVRYKGEYSFIPLLMVLSALRRDLYEAADREAG